MPVTVSTNSPSTNVGALDLEPESDEERGHGGEIRDGDTDMVETSYRCHGFHPPGFILSIPLRDGQLDRG